MIFSTAGIGVGVGEALNVGIEATVEAKIQPLALLMVGGPLIALVRYQICKFPGAAVKAHASWFTFTVVVAVMLKVTPDCPLPALQGGTVLSVYV